MNCATVAGCGSVVKCSLSMLKGLCWIPSITHTQCKQDYIQVSCGEDFFPILGIWFIKETLKSLRDGSEVESTCCPSRDSFNSTVLLCFTVDSVTELSFPITASYNVFGDKFMLSQTVINLVISNIYKKLFITKLKIYSKAHTFTLQTLLSQWL